MNGCASDPPRDVAHLQFKSRIAFKMVWSPNEGYNTLVLVDDEGNLLNQGVRFYQSWAALALGML